jgi:protein SCO1/2
MRCKFFYLGTIMMMIVLPLYAQDEHVHSMAMQDVSVMEGFNIVPEFQLTDYLGNTIDQSILDNNYTLIGFGFTNCPDVCPLMAFNMGMALEQMPVNSQGVFISVDTERDSPQITHDYASSFHPRMSGLSGSIDQINSASNNFKVSYTVTKTPSSYVVQHTSSIYLFGPSRELMNIFSFNDSADVILEGFRELYGN